jgi:hypothetical protein
MERRKKHQEVAVVGDQDDNKVCYANVKPHAE